jgi:hypothetical protein
MRSGEEAVSADGDNYRVIVCGTRDELLVSWQNQIGEVLDALPWNSQVAHGDCKGVDKFCDAYVTKYMGFPLFRFPYVKGAGKAGGPIRNRKMLQEFQPHLVIAFHHDPNLGRGTKDMVKQARKAGVQVKVVLLHG